MTRPRGLRFAKLPHAERVGLRECILRGAATNYASSAGTPEEEAAAGELRDAAIDYAVAVFQRAAFEEGLASPRTRATAKKRGPSAAE